MLEASAGTGKTFTIAALAARYVADGTPLDDLLLVTFTRMATGELRERVRERLVERRARARRGAGGRRADARDEVVRLLADGPRATVELRRRRLARALSDFDAATIATTHGFCQEVLGGLGVAGDIARDGAFAEDVRDLLEEVVDDLYVRRFRTTQAAPAISRARGVAGRGDRGRQPRRPGRAAGRRRAAAGDAPAPGRGRRATSSSGASGGSRS